MARINANICLFFVLTLSQFGWLTPAPLEAYSGESFGIRLETISSMRCYLFDHIELTQLRKQAKIDRARPATSPAEEALAATHIAVNKTPTRPAKICLNCSADSELSKVFTSSLFRVAQWPKQTTDKTIAWAGKHCKDLMTVVAEKSKAAVELQAIKIAKGIGQAGTETIQALANTVVFSKPATPLNNKSTRALKASHRNTIEPADEAIEDLPVPIEEMPIKIKGDHQSPYWQYYEDCDRWGVEFSLLLKEANLFNQNDAVHVTYLKEKKKTHVISVLSTTKETLLGNLNVFDFNTLDSKTLHPKPRFSVLGLIGSQNILGWSYATPRIANMASQSLKGPFELAEFFWIETRDINLELVYVQQLHPITQMVKFGFEPTLKMIADLANTKGSFAKSKIFLLLSPSLSDVMQKFKAQRNVERDQYRNSLADQIDWASDQLKSLANSVRSEKPIESVANRDNANRGGTTQTK